MHLLRLGSVTHSFNQNQSITSLPFTAGAGVLDVSGVSDANLTTPGHYMLFLLDDGVPSVAEIVRVLPAANVPALPGWSLAALAGLLLVVSLVGILARPAHA